MKKKNSTANQKYFKSFVSGVLLGGTKSLCDRNHSKSEFSEWILDHIKKQSMVRENNRKLYKDIYEANQVLTAKSFVCLTEGFVFDLLCNGVTAAFGAFAYYNLALNFYLLGIAGGLLSLKSKEFFLNKADAMDFLVGWTAAITGAHAAVTKEEYEIYEKCFFNEMN